MEREWAREQCRLYSAVAVSALRPETMPRLVAAIEAALGRVLEAGYRQGLGAPSETVIH